MTTVEKSVGTYPESSDPPSDDSSNCDTMLWDGTIPWSDFFDTLPPDRQRKIREQSKILIAREEARRELLVAWDKSRARMAKKLGISRQAELPSVWRDSDALLGILREYVEAEGGTLRIVAEYPDKPPLELREIGELAWWGGDGDEWDY